MASTATPAETTTTLAPTPAERILLFSLGERVYGCAVDGVREIIPSRRATRLPGAPAFVRGLINLRGSLLTVVDLGLRLGEPQPARVDGSTILIEQTGRVLGLAVDEVMDVQPLATDRLDGASAAGEVAGRNAGIVRGVGHLGDGRVVILLDIHSVVSQVLR